MAYRAHHVAVLAACCLLAPSAPDTSAASTPGQLFELSVVHMNDFHARFEETSWSSGSCEAAPCVGGVARLYSAATELLASRPNAVFLNAGDNYQGTLWYTLFKWRLTLHFMNRLPHDAMTLGNHDFDDKLDGLVPFLQGFQYPVVVCNIDDSEEPRIQGLYNKSVVLKRGGRLVGVVGYITTTTKESSKPEKLRFLDEVESVRQEAARLKAAGVDIIIGLSHAGITKDLEVAARVPDIDLIVGGHSHTLLYTGTPPGGDVAAGPYPLVVTQASGKRVPVVQAYAFSKYLGNLTVLFDEQGEPVSWSGAPILMDSSVPQDTGILKEMEPWKAKVAQVGDEQVGRTKVLLDASDSICARGECNLGNMLAQAMVEEYVDHAEEGTWTYAAIAIMNSGGFRSSIEETQNGVITMTDLMTCQPFLNTVDTVELQGRHLLLMLEHSVSRQLNYTGLPGYTGSGFLQVSGLQVELDVSRPLGSRVVSVRVLCDACRVPEYLPLQMDKWYRLALSSFLYEGGDGFTMFLQHGRNHSMGRVDIDVYLQYLAKHSPITQGVDGRIVLHQENSNSL
ncbi:apyrase-like isoform X2 [Bacillus rossius redtenbacheri]|uniref:apyrase-like isoform X2 n=1 Tax=Bacillus rossius redtenbacheri TaxID=93214 RepID=UPI002FDF0A41